MTDRENKNSSGSSAPEKAMSEGIVLTEEQKRSRKSRSLVLALVLAALVILFYAVTLVKGPGLLHRPI